MIAGRMFVRSLFGATVIAIFTTSALCSATADQPPQTTSSPLDSCPAIDTTTPTSGTDRVGIVLSAGSPATVSLRLNFYTLTSTYAVDVPSVAIDTPFAPPFAPYRSKAIVVASIAGKQYLGVGVQAKVGNAYCPYVATGLLTPKTFSPTLSPTPSERSFDEAVDDETRTATVLQPEPKVAPPLTCSQPWVGPSVTNKPQPVVPPIAILAHAAGVVAVRTILNSEGNPVHSTVYSSSGNDYLDGAALDAANHATYKPEIAACMAVAGPILSVVSFRY